MYFFFTLLYTRLEKKLWLHTEQYPLKVKLQINLYNFIEKKEIKEIKFRNIEK